MTDRYKDLEYAASLQRNLKQKQLTEEAIIKHVAGKPEGARYAYFSSLCVLSKEWHDTTIDYLCMAFDDLVNANTTEDKIECIHTMMDLIEVSYNDIKQLWNSVIILRNSAIASGKYTVNGYKNLNDVTLLEDAIARHLIAFIFQKELIDPESGQSHLAHVVANLAMIAAVFRAPQ